MTDANWTVPRDEIPVTDAELDALREWANAYGGGHGDVIRAACEVLAHCTAQCYWPWEVADMYLAMIDTMEAG